MENTEKEEFPLILSPNLGCPKLISIKEVFSWDEKDINIKEFLIQKFGFDWIRTAKIEKFNNGMTIMVSGGKKFISMGLNNEKTTVNVKIDDGRITKFISRSENGKLNIYERVSINIILAGQYGELTSPTKEMFTDAFKLVSSYPGDFSMEIPLSIEEEITEITGWGQLFDFSHPEDTQMLINSEVHYNILGEGTKYFLIKAVIKTDEKEPEYETFLNTGVEGKSIPTLYDLVFTDEPSHKKINYHAVQFIETSGKRLNFIHLTDLHVAQRNDDILGEVLKNGEKGMRSRKQITERFINFNDNLRKFIYVANEMAQRGELDFIVITGDIVDFSGLGWNECINPAENNWKVFINLVTGQSTETSRRFRLQIDDNEENINPGLKVAIFTTTGNHDWRLHPYGLLPLRLFSKTLQPGKNGEYGLTEEEAKKYNYKSFDSSEYPGDERKILADAIMLQSLNRLNLKGMNWQDKGYILMANVLKYLSDNLKINSIATGLVGLISAYKFLDYKDIFLKLLELLYNLTDIYAFFKIVLILLAALFIVGALSAFPFALNWIAQRMLKPLIDLMVDNPIHAEAKSLHYYFKHINPYFDYAFSFGNNHFVLMDTGADVAALRAENLREKVDPKYLKKLTIQDNFIGSSPDSMAFDDRQSCYNWEQIIWLDKVLSAVSRKKSIAGKGRTFVCLHAPPVNYDTHYKSKLEELRESKLIEKNESSKTFIEAEKEPGMTPEMILRIIGYIPQKLGIKKKKDDKCLNLTYGTVNHYLSQFFFMCMGYRENPHRNKNSRPLDQGQEKVDLILSGHAHMDVEFRLGIDETDPDENKIRIYHDVYSDFEKFSDFDKNKPVIVQSAACGPPGENDKKKDSNDEFDRNKLPHWRTVQVDEQNHITSFKQESLDEFLKNQKK